MSEGHERRIVLKTMLGFGLALPLLDAGGFRVDSAVAQPADPKTVRPQEGDHFTFASGERAGQVITAEDLPVGGPQLIAYPMDPKTKIVKSGSRLNQVLLVRLGPEDLTEATRALSADGIVAYSAVCTHTGCDVTGWKAETKTFQCFCHFSVFDPKDGANVLDGPAPRRLAALPLKIADGVLMAAGGFKGRVGFQQA
jgi:rieske iron-sulfur protein